MYSKTCPIKNEDQGPQMIDNFIHDIRNKLAVAMGKTSKILRNQAFDRKDMESIESALLRMAELLKGLQHATSNEKIEVNTTLETSGAAVFGMLEQMYQVKYVVGKLESFEQNTKMVIGHASMLKIMENLTENAARAGASIINLSDRIEGDFIYSILMDNGKGCHESTKIGTGWTSRKDLGGTGLGTKQLKDYFLSIGGDINWTSTEHGMIVSLRIPIDRETMPKALKAA